jgi:hypothetical protein
LLPVIHSHSKLWVQLAAQFEIILHPRGTGIGGPVKVSDSFWKFLPRIRVEGPVGVQSVSFLFYFFPAASITSTIDLAFDIDKVLSSPFRCGISQQMWRLIMVMIEFVAFLFQMKFIVNVTGYAQGASYSIQLHFLSSNAL